MINDFYLYRHAWISAPHFNRQLSDAECDELLKHGGWMVRNTYDFDQKEESDFWYIIKDSFGGMDELSPSVRRSIRKSLKSFNYRLIEKKLIEEQGYSIMKKAFDNYAVQEITMNKQVFLDFLDHWDENSHEFWGIFTKNDDKFVGFSVVRVYDNVCFYDRLVIDPTYKKKFSYGFYYKRNEYYFVEKGYKFVTDGTRSITEHSNIQTFLVQKFKYRKAYCKLKIRYKWWFGAIVRVLLPFRKLIRNRNVKAVLNMHMMQY